MSYTTTYRYTASVIDLSTDRTSVREGNVTVGGSEGHTGARRVVEARYSQQGLTVTNIHFEPMR